MDFEPYIWLLLGLPIAFGLGWLASRFDLRQLKFEHRSAPKAYFKGLNYLLNEQQDQAIDAFIEAVQNDPDTSELHFGLGNLFRRRGEYERAVRVHEHLLARGDLKQADRERAQHALALDFLQAGLLDRAEAALHKLENTALASQAQWALLGLYERSRQWQQAIATARQLEVAGQGSCAGRIAHYLCEQAAGLDDAQALALLQQAHALAPQAPRPALALADLHLRQQRPDLALATLLELAQNAPSHLPLAATQLARLAQNQGQPQAALDALLPRYQDSPSVDLLDALAVLASDDAAVRALYAAHLEREPSALAALHWLARDAQLRAHLPPALWQALEQGRRPLAKYQCAACGFSAAQHFWQCPGCQAWDSFPALRVAEL